MAETELRCNFKHCRKIIEGNVYVTSCSHIFCDEDGEKHFAQSLTCPACEANLNKESDIFRTNVNPSESHRSMILAGQRPEVIVDILSRALNFWNYQIYQEKVYQEWVYNKLRDHTAAIEVQYQGMISKLQTETEMLKSKLTNVAKEMNELHKRYDDVAEKYNAKVRQYQTLSTSYETLRRKVLTPNIYGATSARSHDVNTQRHSMHPKSREDNSAGGGDGFNYLNPGSAQSVGARIGRTNDDTHKNESVLRQNNVSNFVKNKFTPVPKIF